jgi:hypothetical protein
MAVREPDAAMMKAAAMEHGASGTEPATVKHRATAAVEHCGATVKSTTAMETSTAVKAATTVETTSATAMSTAAAMSAATTTVSTAADFGRHSAGRDFRRRCSAWIDQRQCLRTRWNR